ncbi:hypothetical protein PF005_g16847 [Phytophthora fragariae]|uniref:Uncharacterized protein n=2 Tax=Phytophthora fragariae TaxID=53985 RepID=A0A6A3Y4N5_9STRA|nr:hypothetical protein PF003_g34175 [Phytophthora fragariae]KAE8931423.1 hypothetical protein PF009_g18522 [Phytophthora fragariae]KAE8995462.1 hypothetical protein PF011_g16323 [Phytophthora fragariae]KAE9095384.1 hypothetical protein PF007_g17401 [Phytophthora fragariae]KAE9126407.1 hypothetical protein PF006_g16739 [Phytophthora fragariae]
MNSPGTDADQSSSSTSASPEQPKALHHGSWLSSAGGGGGLLPLLRAANACDPETRTAAMTPHTDNRLPLADLSTAKRQRTMESIDAISMRSWDPPLDAQWPLVKRRAAQDAEEKSSSDHEEEEEETAPVVKRKKKRGYRKATHTIRKEEIDHLRVELAQLQAQMAELQQRAFAPDRDSENENERRLYSNVLHNAVRKHQEAFVEIQAAMTGYAACNIQAGSPIQRTIILGRDELSRKQQLRSIKALRLQDARDFFSRRLSHLNPLKSMSEDYRFESDEGDYWAVRFATSQFESAQSVKQVFDLVVYYLCNIEISVSEKMGHLTVREDDDNSEEGITQNRLVSLTGKGLRMESNTVVFSDYFGATGPGQQDDYGLISADFVDEDKRHPYRPAERIRKDVNTVMEDGWYELRENMDRWSQNMHNTIMESLDPPNHGPPTWRIDG